MVLIFKFYTVPVRLHDVKNFGNQRALSSKHVSIFYRENMKSFLDYITATAPISLKFNAELANF